MTSQKIVEEAVRGISGVAVCLDDVINTEQTEEEHDRRVQQALSFPRIKSFHFVDVSFETVQFVLAFLVLELLPSLWCCDYTVFVKFPPLFRPQTLESSRPSFRGDPQALSFR